MEQHEHSFESPDQLEKFRDNLNTSWGIGAIVKDGEIIFSMPEGDIRLNTIEERFGEKYEINKTETGTQDSGGKVYLFKIKPKK